MGWYQNDWGVMGFVGLGMMLLVWGAVMLLAVWAVARATRSSPSQAMPLESARVILDRRFASGEIDAEEYARSRRTLEATDAPA